MTESESDFARLVRLEKERTQGELRATADCADSPLLLETMKREYIGSIKNWRDAEFIALASNLMPRLLEVVEAAKKVSDQLQSDGADGYVDTHTAASLAESLKPIMAALEGEK